MNFWKLSCMLQRYVSVCTMFSSNLLNSFLTSSFLANLKLQELKANPHRNAKGTVIEACLDKAKGPLATLVVQNGTLNKADIIVCGEAYGKVGLLYSYLLHLSICQEYNVAIEKHSLAYKYVD
jgi:translation initiation factor IF-2